MAPAMAAPARIALPPKPVWDQLERTPGAPVVINQANRPEKLPYRLASRTTNYFHAIPSQARNIELVAQRLNGTVVQPGHVFSYYQRIGPYTRSNGYGWGRMFAGDRILPSIGGGGW